MNKLDKVLLVLSVSLLIVGFVGWVFDSSSVVVLHKSDFVYDLRVSVYATVTFYRAGRVVYYFAGLDPLTKLGLNLTFAKLSGSNSYNLTTYSMNSTFVSLGNYTTVMTSDTTQLAGEFIRVAGVVHAQVYNGFNVTGSFSGFAGTNSSNCMGLEYAGSGFGNDLFGYTTFGLVTGIGSDWSITAEIQVVGTIV
jgi:hypothetical protein